MTAKQIKILQNKQNRIKKNYTNNNSENGSATINFITLTTLALSAIWLTLQFIEIVVNSHTVSAAADLAALAAADTVRGIVAGEPCLVAAEIIEKFDGIMVSCEILDNDSASIKVAKTIKIFQAFGFARAGSPI